MGVQNERRFKVKKFLLILLTIVLFGTFLQANAIALSLFGNNSDSSWVGLANPGGSSEADEAAQINYLIGLGINATDSFNMLAVIGGIQKLVDTISKVQTREALTANESIYYATRLADILTTGIAYIRKEAISDEDALRYILGELRNSIEIPRLSGGTALLGE